MEPEIITGLFSEYDEAQAAVNDLLADGFDHDAINLLASNTTDRFAAGYGAMADVGSLFAIGSLASSVVGESGELSTDESERSGLRRGLQTLGIDAREANYYADGLGEGGTLLAVRADSAAAAQEAQTALKRYGAQGAPAEIGSRHDVSQRTVGLTADPDLHSDEDTLFDFEQEATEPTGIRAYAARL